MKLVKHNGLVLETMTAQEPLLADNYICGKSIHLEQLTPEYSGFVLQMYELTTFMSIFSMKGIPSIEDIASTISLDAMVPLSRRTKMEWAIVDNSSSDPFGLATLFDYDRNHGRATMIIGTALHYNTASFNTRVIEAILLILEYGFNTVGLHKITAVVHENETHIQDCLELLGFHQDGVLREHYKTSDGFVSMVVYTLLENEITDKIEELSLALAGKVV